MEELTESELGTKTYWDSRYDRELQNYKSHGDPGEIWFGEDIVGRVIKWIKKNELISAGSAIADVGCGNGMFLVELAAEGYSKLTGLDYSEGAISLANEVAKVHGFHIIYTACDVLQGLPDKYDVIHDKGTYDAISLSSNAKDNRLRYLTNLQNSLNNSGLFIITSCNWTKEELDEQFSNFFHCFEVIPTPQFKFGGKIGNVVTSVVYRNICK